MKVLDVTDFYSDRGGGIRSHLDAKGRALAALGVDHVTLAPGARDGEETLTAPGSRPSARVLRVRGPAQPYDASYRFLTRTRRAAAVVIAERPDVLELDSLYLAARVARRVPRDAAPVRTAFWHSDHVDTHLVPRLAPWLGTRGAERVAAPAWGAIRGVLSQLDATIAASRVQCAKLERHGVPRVHHIPFGVDRRHFRPEARSPGRRAELLGAGREGAWLLLAVGRLSVEKQWPVVIDAFLSLRRRHDAVLIVIGDGPERAKLERRASQDPDVRFHGFETDRARFAATLASADALLHGCPHETFGLSVAEAVACGLPVVVPDAGGAGELAVGPSARRYASGDACACAAAVEELLALPAETRRAAALAAAARVGTMEDHFRAVVELYRELTLRATRRG